MTDSARCRWLGSAAARADVYMEWGRCFAASVLLFGGVSIFMNEDINYNEYPPVQPVIVDDADARPVKKPARDKKEKNVHVAAVIVGSKKGGKFGVDFMGYGVGLVSDKLFKVGDTVKVRYASKVGCPDFKIELV
jgi:hypothetical protein